MSALQNNLVFKKPLTDYEGNVITFYHGTGENFTHFSDDANAQKHTFFATDRGFAEEWLENNIRGDEPQIISAHVLSSNAWDYRSKEHVKLLLDYCQVTAVSGCNDEYFIEGIEDGDWMHIERTPGLIEHVKSLGFDCMFITEGSDCDRNLMVFSSNQIVVHDREYLKKSEPSSPRP